MKSDKVESIYPLSPPQEGMLFHTLYDAEPGIYLVQFTCALRGSLDPEAFRGVWRKVYDRHAALRSVFHWEGLEKPVQVVLRQVDLRWTEEDWRGLPAPEQARRWEDLLRAHRRQGLDLSSAPLARHVLVQPADGAWLFAWEVTHLVVDGWSIPILLGEVFTLYAGACRRREVLLEPGRPYRDYVLWLLRQDLGEAERFWRRLLAGFHTPTPLPVDRLAPRRPAAEDGFGYLEQIRLLSAALLDRLAALGRRYQLTFNTLVQGAWAVLLSRYSGEGEVVFGSTVSGRSVPLPGIDRMIGLFINTLPVRTQVQGETLLLPWLRRLQAQQAEARQYEFTPLAQVQGWSDVQRGVPLFETIVVFEKFPVDPAARNGVGEAVPLSVHEVRTLARSNYPLTVLAEVGEGLKLQVKHDPSRFESTTVTRLLGHLEELLGAMAADPMQPLEDLSVLTPAERHQIVLECNDTRIERPRGSTLHGLFEERAARTPEAVALVAGDLRFTYRELEERANRLARHLRSLGVGPGSSVAVYLDRCWQMVPALLGILKSGAAYVPLEITYPAARVEWILSAMQVPCVLTQGSQIPLLEGLRPALPRFAEVLDVESWDGPLSTRSGAPLPPSAGAGDLAYTIFTSGSTGTPKGVQVLHGVAVHLVEWVNETFGVGPEDRVLFVTSLCFDLSVYDVFGLLAAGGSIRLASTPEMRDPARLVRALFDEPITFWDTAPAFLQQLVPLWEAEEPPAETRLHLVFLSGDWVPLALPDLVRSVFRHTRVIALGGATEATVWSNFFPVGEVEPHWTSIPYGRPIWNSRYYVLDSRLEPCALGVPGDLYIAGDCLASGYAGEPGLTADRFLADRFAPEPGARMYRTGDRARFRLDGSLEFLGRLDHQVKVRGFRIELGEIEAVLKQHPGVRSAVALAREDTPGRKRLVAYCLPAPGEPEPETEELRRFVAGKLPEYMVPSALVFLESFPVTPNGKLDRRALPDPDLLLERRERPVREPRNETERALARIWSELLRTDRVGIEDNYFELGGDSILSIQIVSRAAREGIRLLPRQIFEHPTIAELAAVARQVAGEGEEAAETAEGRVPLSPAQHWFFEQDLIEPHHFNQALLLETGLPLRAPLLREALRRVADHHSVFSLRFHRSEGGWEQVHAEEEPSQELAFADLSALPQDRRKAALGELAGQVQAGFDLGRGPLLRGVLFHLRDGELRRLLLVAHHLVVDAVSWRILLEDLETVYRDLERGGLPSLPRTTPFGRWAARLAEHARSPEVARELSDWLAAERTSVSPLPADHPGGRNVLSSTDRIVVTLTEEETRTLLQDLPELYRSSIDEALLSALASAVAAWTGSGRVLVDLERHGREEIFPDVDLTRTVGWFTAFVPLLLEVEEDAPPVAALKAVKEQVRRVPGRGLGHGLLLHLSGDPEVAARLRALPRPEIVFNYLGQLDQALPASSPFRAARESAGPARSPLQARRHLLEMTGYVAGGLLQVSFGYSPAIHEAATLGRLARRFVERLRGLVEHCATEEAGAFTPADFPEARLDAAGLDALLHRIGSGLGAARLGPRSRVVESISELSPAQEGMLFHTLYSPEDGVYSLQLSCTLEGELDRAAFHQAWQRTLDRHAILRSAFFWEGLRKPLQVAFRHAALPLVELDWSDLPGEGAAGTDAALERFAREDRRRGFDLSRAPLLRLTLIRTGEARHYLVWTCHHLLVDGWSLTLVLQELFQLYRALREGAEPGLGPVRPFRDYIAWLHRQDLAGAKEFWSGLLAGLAGPTPLAPGLAPRPLPEGEEGGQLVHRLASPLAAGLESLARGNQLTLFSCMQGAWALLLARYNRTADVVFGSAVSGRPPELPGVDSIVGPFLNTLPVRVRLSPEDRVLPWLAALQAGHLELRQYEFTPLVEIQSWSEIPAGTPLFDTLLVFDSYPTDESAGPPADGLRVRAVGNREQTSYPWTLSMSGAHQGLEVLFDPHRFDEADARRILGHFENALAAFVEDPRRRLDEVDLLSAAERQQILREGNDGGTPEAGEGVCLHHLFERQAARTPDAPALVVDGETLTYRELDRRAGLLARHLRRLGVGPEVAVGICLERSASLLLGALAVLKAGGAYVPLDPGQPVERLASMLETSGARLLLAGDGAPPGLETGGTALLRLPAELADLPAEDRTEERAGLPESLAYIVFTSGSTGRPKGVQVTHRSLVNHALAVAALYRLGPGDRVLQFAPFAFDLAAEEVFPTWASGGCVVLRPQGPVPAFSELAGWIGRDGITVLNLPTAYWHEWVEDLERNRGGVPECLRLLIVGTEQALADRLEAWRRIAGSRVRWINAYGTSETTITSTVHDPGSSRPAAGRGVPVGRPIANVSAYVLDPGLRLLPAGAVGEIHVGGRGVARGYAGDPARTAAVFLPDPSDPRPGARLYATGDLGRRLADGSLQHLGRKDDQVKIRGFRVEPGEVEAVLAGHPGVRAAAVVLAGGEIDRELVAYVVPSEENGLELGELRGFAARALPSFMIPAEWVLLPELPLTPNGKVDRGALPSPARPFRTADLHRDLPRGQVAEILAGIFAEVLGITFVGGRDDFFEQGGHSLLATQVVSRVREAFGVALPLPELFERPTVDGLAPRLEELLEEGQERLPLRPAPREGDLPLSYSQERLWLFDQLQPGSAAYNIPTAVRLRGEVDLEALETAFREIARRHESLRTVFAEREGRPVQVILPPGPVDLAVTDLTGVGEDWEAEARRRVGFEIWRPFDLARGPLWRAGILRASPTEHVVWVSMHHIVSDGWSMTVFIREMAALYAAFAAGEPSPLPELPLQYADVAVWQRERLRGDTLDRLLAFWEQELAGAPVRLDLPTDRPRPQIPSFRGAAQAFALPPALGQAVVRLSRSQGTTVFMTLLAAFQVLLWRYTGQPDFVVGSVVANRDRRETEGIVGFFVNNLALRADLSGDPDFREVLARVRAATLRAYAHQELPLDLLIDRLHLRASPDAAPFSQVRFILENYPPNRLEVSGLSLSPFQTEGEAPAKTDLTLYMQQSGEELHGVFVYDADLFTASAIERLALRFRTLLEEIVPAPERRLAEVALEQAPSGEEIPEGFVAELEEL